uniref:Uncharacterized protein n=1 Tax=mine drainage metagenome TaxID=410659 RepID=E6Q4R2_9ZZZZ
MAPGAGAPPPEMAGRESIVQDGVVNIERNKRGLHEKPLLISGLRGVGLRTVAQIHRKYRQTYVPMILLSSETLRVGTPNGHFVQDGLALDARRHHACPVAQTAHWNHCRGCTRTYCL